MASPQFIDKKEKLNEAQDYDFLKEKGLDYVQELAGDNWTDYNAHDPGVTILEQLVFALTDLGYRSNLDIEDLLASQKQTDGKSSLFTAAQILSSNPVTVNDYRKIIIDSIKEVSNIWILPLNSFTRRKNVKGLYLALLEVKHSHKHQSERVRLEVKKYLNKFSNLGEAFEDVIVLEEQEIYIDCNIELEADALPEEVHAEILFELQKLISRPLKFYSLKEMLDRGTPVNRIFDGPHLKNGFIRDEFLLEKDSVFYSSQFLNVIRTVKGVRSINYFNILLEESDNDFKDYKDELSDSRIEDLVLVDWGKKAVLGSKILKDANDQRFISYTRDGASINLFQREVDRNLKALNAKTKVQFSGKEEHKDDFDIPEGKPFNIGHYHSVQHNFPNLYALGKNGLPSSASDLRKAQTFQLKAYLLLFEQLISDHLEQLTRFNSLFELDKELGASYFTQIPTDIPGLFKLVGSLKESNFPSQDQADFESAVLRIKSELEDFSKRRRSFLAHLFARFGDDSFKLHVEKYNYYYSEEANKKQTEINWLNQLQAYPHLSGDKARSFDHTSPFFYSENDNSVENANLSVLEKRIRLSIGLSTDIKKIATNLSEKVNFNKSKPKNIAQIERAHPSFSVQLFEKKSLALSEDEAQPFDDSTKPNLNIEIDEDLFRRGIWEDNLRVIEDPRSDDDDCLLLFRIKQEKHDATEKSSLEEGLQNLIAHFSASKEQEDIEILLISKDKARYSFQFKTDHKGNYSINKCQIFRVLGSYADKNEAFKEAKLLKKELIQMNMESEGFFVLDHILLRPRTEQMRVNTLLHDPTSDWSVRLFNSHEFQQIEEGLTQDIKILRDEDFEPDIIEIGKNKWIIQWVKNGRAFARCNQKFESEEAADQKAAEIQQYFEAFSDFDMYNPEKLKFKREFENHKHPLHHYSFTISVFLSGWTSRFRDPEMRNLVQILFRKFTPAHIGINFQWLDLDDMVEFEELYTDWLTENRKEELEFEYLNEKSDQILAFAKRHVNE